MEELRILNLYAGLGGNRQKWRGQIHITAVEMETEIADIYKAQFPDDELVIGDAHQYLLDHSDEFDFVWSSPPCQTHSKMMKATRHKKRRYSDMSLYQEILFLQHFYKGKWVVENVKPYYDPLIKPTGALGRHLFWSNFKIGPFELKTFLISYKMIQRRGVNALRTGWGFNMMGIFITKTIIRLHKC